MRVTTTISLWIVRVAGTVQLILGILLWAGRGHNFLPLHIVNGILIVLAMWTVAGTALVARARTGLAVFVLVWGLALAAFGMRQAAVLVGEMHWIVRAVHLLMGLIAMGAGTVLAKAMLAVILTGARRPRLDREAAAASRLS